MNQLPTAFAPPAEAVDRLRAAARKIILNSADFQARLKTYQDNVAKGPASR